MAEEQGFHLHQGQNAANLPVAFGEQEMGAMTKAGGQNRAPGEAVEKCRLGMGVDELIPSFLIGRFGPAINESHVSACRGN